MELVIDPELRDLIPPLEDSERESLEASLRRDGCLDALKVWKDGDRQVLIDGHNRKEICDQLGIGYAVEEVKSIGSRYEAITWMIDLQLSRRNLPPMRQSYLRGRRYNEEKLMRGGNRGNQYTVASSQNENLPKTSERIAAEYGVSRVTISRDALFAAAVDALSPEDRLAVLGGKSPLKKRHIIEDYLVATGRKEPSSAPVEKDYQMATRKALAVLDDLMANYSQVIRFEIVQSTVEFLQGCRHVRSSEVDRIWRETRKRTATRNQ